MAIRTETITIPDLAEGEEVTSARVVDGAIVVTIVDTAEGLMEAGERFLGTSHRISRVEKDKSIWSDPDPRLRRILDR